MTTGVHVSINAEPIFNLGGFTVTNSIFTSLIVSGLIILFALIVRLTLKKTDKPTGIQSLAEWIVESLYNFVHSIAGDSKKTYLFMPLIATLFLFILLNNWFGLIPGVGTIGRYEKPETTIETGHAEPDNSTDTIIQTNTHETSNQPTNLESHTSDTSTNNPDTQTSTAHSQPKFIPFFRPGTADLNTTIALALVSFVCIQGFGFTFQSLGYLKKFFNFSSPIFTFVGLLELMGEFAKIISFAFRLFGNVFAGEVLLTVIASLIAAVVPVPFYGLEVFVGFIQALVFAMLTLVFINMAAASHSEH